MGTTREDASESSYSARDYYQGAVVDDYVRLRNASDAARKKWEREGTALAFFLDSFEKGSLLLDMPCGTGRYDDLFVERSLDWVGVDISADMIRAAQQGRGDGPAAVGYCRADGESLPIVDLAFDHAVVSRFFNLVPLTVVEAVLVELRRVVRGSVAIHIRIDEQKATDPLVRKGRRLVNALRRRVRGEGPAKAARDPLRVHRADEVRAVLERSGWREVGRREVVVGRLPLRVDPLWFLLLEPA